MKSKRPVVSETTVPTPLGETRTEPLRSRRTTGESNEGEGALAPRRHERRGLGFEYLAEVPANGFEVGVGNVLEQEPHLRGDVGVQGNHLDGGERRRRGYDWVVLAWGEGSGQLVCLVSRSRWEWDVLVSFRNRSGTALPSGGSRFSAEELGVSPLYPARW